MVTTDTTQSISGAKTFTSNVTVGSTFTLANPGVGVASTITFTKSTDAAGITAIETSNDALHYAFTMGDNPDGGDAFALKWDSWHGAGTGWTPYLYAGGTADFVATTMNIRARVNVPTGAFVTAAGTSWSGRDYVATSTATVQAGAPSATLTIGGGTYSGTSTQPVWLDIDAGGTTFSWGYGSAVTSRVAQQTGLTVSTGVTNLNNGMTVQFSSTVVTAGDRWAWRIWPATFLRVNNFDVLTTSQLGAKGTLISASAANTPSALTVGSNNQVLLADSTTTPGIKWGSLPVGSISATGTASATTFLAGDGSWKTALTAAPSNMVTTDGAQTISAVKSFSATSTGFATAATTGGAVIGDGGSAALGPELKLNNSGTAHWSIRNVSGALNIGTTSSGTTLGLAMTNYLAITTSGATVTGTFNSTGNLSENGNRVYTSANLPPAPSGMMTTNTDQFVASTKTFQETGAATSTTTTRNSYGVHFVSSYWNGTAAAQETITLSNQRASATATDMYLTVQNGKGFSGERYRAMSTGNFSRYVGGVTTAAPTSGTWEVRDFAIGSDGKIWVCTVAGTPGTWVQVQAAASAPSNMVTTDTNQTISGVKTFDFVVDPVRFTMQNGTTTNMGANGNFLAFFMEGNNGVDFIGSDGFTSMARVSASGSVTGTSVYDGGNRVYSANNKVPVSGISATGTTDATTYLRGDGTWATPAGGGGSTTTDLVLPGTGGNNWRVTANATSGALVTTTTTDPANVAIASNLSAPANMVTTDTTQTISGTKTFSANNNFTGFILVNSGVWLQANGNGANSRALDFSSRNNLGTLQDASVSARPVANAPDGTKPDLVATAPFYATALYDNNNRVYSASNTPPAPSNMVTTDTTQTITGQKTFVGDLTLNQASGALSGGSVIAYGSGNLVVTSPNSDASNTPQFATLYLTSTRWNGTASESGQAALYASRTATGTRLVTDTAFYAPSIYDNGTRLYTSIEPYVMSVTGALTVQTGKSRVYLEAGYAIESVRASVNTAPAGASVIVDVNLNGTSIFTTQANRPTIVAGANTATGTPNTTTVASGQYLTVDVDQIGSTTAGSDLTVVIRLRRTS